MRKVGGIGPNKDTHVSMLKIGQNRGADYTDSIKKNPFDAHRDLENHIGTKDMWY